MRVSRALALLYTAILVASIFYVVIIAITFRNDPGEHLLPGFVLAFVCAPLDMMVFYILPLLPDRLLEAIGWSHLILVASCGAAQAVFLLWLTRPVTTWRSTPINRINREHEP